VDHPRETAFSDLLQFPGLAERHVFEIAAAVLGAKPVVRVVVPIEHIEGCSGRLRALGLHVALPTRALAIDQETSLGDRYCRHVPLTDPAAVEVALLASLNIELAEKGRYIDENGSVRQTGELYGYPTCCILQYEKIEENPDWVRSLLLDHIRRGGRPPSVSNKLAYLFSGNSFLPDYFPCSLHCRPSEALARRMRAAALTAGLSRLVSDTEREVCRPIIAYAGSLLRPRSYWHDGSSIQFTAGNLDVFPLQGQAESTLLEKAAGACFDAGCLVLLDATGAAFARDKDGVLVEFEDQLQNAR
jgi:hypothetical protein